MKKLIIAISALAAMSAFAVTGFAADASDKIETEYSRPAQCSQEYCEPQRPQDGTGNKYGTENKNTGECICQYQQTGTCCRSSSENKSEKCQKRAQTNCTNDRQRLRLGWEK